MSYITKANKNTKNILNYSSGLNDTLVDRWFIALKNIFGFYIERALSVITYRVNWNKGLFCYITECVSYGNVRDIVTIYINLVKQGKIPEYDRVNNAKFINFIENEVFKIYGRNINDVKVVLWELYYATLDGSLSTDEFLRPLTYKKTANYKEKPELEGNSTGVEGFINNLAKTLKIVIWIIIIASISYLGYTIYNSFNTYKNIKQLNK